MQKFSLFYAIFDARSSANSLRNLLRDLAVDPAHRIIIQLFHRDPFQVSVLRHRIQLTLESVHRDFEMCVRVSNDA